MTSAAALIVALAIAPVVALASWGVVRRRQGDSAVRTALAREGYQVLRLEHRIIRQGPFWATATRSHHVYRVVARDASGRDRVAWARWGRTWLLDSDTLDLQWDR